MLPRWKQLKTDPIAQERMAKRAKIVAAIRVFFASRDFVEAETPILVRYPGMEPNLDVFATELRRADGKSYVGHLITSPEYSLKKLLAAGYPRLFEITRCFRNSEPWSDANTQSNSEGPSTHNPEFSMLEWYRADVDYRAIMDDLESLVAQCCEAANGSTSMMYAGQPLDLSPGWPRLSVAEAMERYAGLDLSSGIDNPEKFRSAAVAKGHIVTPQDSFDDVFFKIFLRDVEPYLGKPERSGQASRPVIIYDYPRSQAALARLKPGDNRYAERFEAYVAGLELANAFSELNDATEQRNRLKEEAGMRQAAGRFPWAIDEQFVAAVGEMPPAAGIALGVDRLVMLLTDARDIRDVLFFPASDLFE